MEAPLPAIDKRESFLELLDTGMTMLHLDARSDGVDVPEQFRTDVHLRLNFSYRFHLDTFTINKDKVEASLSFGGSPYLCVIPWTAVFGMTSHVAQDFRVWPEAMPTELLQQAAAMADAEPVDSVDLDEELPVIGGAVRRVGHLRVIK